MNERIRELATEVGISVEYLTNTKQIVLLEKFAELIVKECVDCARGAVLADDVASRNKLGFNDGISEAVTHIQKHFGVEE